MTGYVNVRNKDGNTPLMLALRSCEDKAVISQLISQGADVNARNNYGRTPLMYAIIYSNAETVALLLKNGADRYARDMEGCTVMYYLGREKTDDDVREVFYGEPARTIAEEKAVHRIDEAFRDILSWRFSIDKEFLTSEKEFVEDLGFEPEDILALATAEEARFGTIVNIAKHTTIGDSLEALHNHFGIYIEEEHFRNKFRLYDE